MPVNFLLVVMFYPSAVILYERHIKYKYVCWGDRCSNKQGELGKVEQFCDTTLNNFVHKARYVILGVSAIWLSITIWQTAEIVPAK